MKNLEKDQLETLFDIIGDTPSYQIAHFSQGGELFTKTLSEYCQKRDYLYQINCTDKLFYEQATELHKDEKNTKVMLFNLARPSYMIQAREYNFLFVTNLVEEEKRLEFLKKVHKIIRSAGSIIVFIPKEGYAQRDSWVASLEENLFVSTSIIDDMFENYDVIISRKMHGWGD